MLSLKDVFWNIQAERFKNDDNLIRKFAETLDGEERILFNDFLRLRDRGWEFYSYFFLSFFICLILIMGVGAYDHIASGFGWIHIRFIYFFYLEAAITLCGFIIAAYWDIRIFLKLKGDSILRDLKKRCDEYCLNAMSHFT